MFSDDIHTAYRRTIWSLVFRGLLGIALGIFILARPLASVAAFAVVIAVWALVDGIVTIVRAVALRRVVPHWGVLLLSGTVSAIFGVAALYLYPALSLAYAVIWAALWLLIAGALAVFIAVHERRLALPWGWTMAFGVIAIVAGVYAVIAPGITLVALMAVLAAFGIAGGITLLVAAGRMRSIERDVTGAVHGAMRT